MTNAQTLAQSLYDALVTATRADGSEFIRLADGSPEWMKTAVRDSHCGMLPDDTRYRMIRECAGALADLEDWEDTHEIADGLVDIYNNDRLVWLASHLTRADYCDDAQSEDYVSESASMFDRIGAGQYMEYSEILGSLVHSLQNVDE